MTALGTVVVTGGSSGLGAAVCRAVAAAGGNPVAFDLTTSPDARWTTHKVDVADPATLDEAVAATVAVHGPVRGLVTAAGIDSCGPLAEVPADTWRRVIEVNLIGTANTIRALLPQLRAEGGRLVTVASTLGLRTLSDATAYCASKFGVVGLTRAVTLELAGEVGVTLLLPGGMATPFFDGRPEQYRPGPDAHLNRPDDVAAAAVFALTQPPGCEIRELVVTPSREPSWP